MKCNGRGRRGATKPRHGGAWRRLRFAAAWICVGSLGAAVGPAQVQAQTAVPAGPSVLDAAQEQERLLRAREAERLRQLQVRPDVRLAPPPGRASDALPVDETPCFSIDTVVLDGPDAALFPFLQAAAAGPNGLDRPQGRCLGAAGINQVMARLQDALVARGYVTSRVLAPPQDLRSGQLTLTVLAGRVGALRLAPEVPPEQAQRATLWNAFPLRTGDVLQLRDAEQGLENLQRVPTARSAIRFEPGEQPGESDVVVAWEQTRPLRLALFLDDGGSRATGRYQGGLAVSYDHALTLHDVLSVSLNRDLGGTDAGAGGTRGHVLQYSLPLGYWTLSASGTRSTYRQTVVGATQDFVFSGISTQADLRLNRVVYRDATHRTTVGLRGWRRGSANFIDDTEIQVQRRTTAGWDLSVNHRAFIQRSTWDATVSWRQGTGALGARRAPEELFGEGTSRPRLITLDASLVTPFRAGGAVWRHSATARVQFHRTPLTPQDRFSIGGRYAVRGFGSERSLAGDRGGWLRQDLERLLGDSGMAVYGGLDYGEVGGPSSARLAGRRLMGGVLGVRGQAGALSLDVFVGWPLRQPDGFGRAGPSGGFQMGVSL